MEPTTTISAWMRGHEMRASGGGSNIQVCQSNMHNLRWLYKQFRKDGLKPSDARMNLVFAFAAGQRDMRTRVYAAVR